MKLGQITKIALEELKTSRWRKRNVVYESQFSLGTTVDPTHSRAVEILMKAGLNRLQRYNTHWDIFLEHDIYLNLISYHKNPPRPSQDFFIALENSIEDYVTELANGWHIFKGSHDRLSIPERYIETYGKDIFTVEHPALGASDVLLRCIGLHTGEYPDQLSVDEYKDANKKRHVCVTGKRAAVLNFVNTLTEQLSPSSQAQDDIPTLKSGQPLQQTLERFSLFYPGVFSLKRAREQTLPCLEDIPMEHIQSWKDMQRYQGKIIVYQTHSYYLGDSRGYLINPDQPELKVGMIDDYEADMWEGGETGYNLTMLLKPSEVAGNHALVTSKVKYAQLKVRLPSIEELDKIKQAVESKTGEFEYAGYNNKEIVAKIETQKSEPLTMPVRKKIKFT